MMLHTKYQGYMPCDSRYEHFHVFHIIILCQTCDPWQRPYFWHHGHNFNIHGRGILGDATYQMLRL